MGNKGSREAKAIKYWFLELPRPCQAVKTIASSSKENCYRYANEPEKNMFKDIKRKIVFCMFSWGPSMVVGWLIANIVQSAFLYKWIIVLFATVPYLVFATFHFFFKWLSMIIKLI